MAVMEMPLETSDASADRALTPRDEIAARWAAGDPDALRLAFEAWGAAIHTYCTRRVPSDDAADATQEVFVAAWRARAQFDPTRGNLAQWLFGIARNTCVTVHRRAARTPSPMAEPPAMPAAPGREDGLPDRLILSGALARLPERQRAVVVASFVERWTNQEVAQRMNLPLGTVKSDIRRGLRALRSQLEGDR
jgi:RNA polymerase sigma factor (sigma-70 family)